MPNMGLYFSATHLPFELRLQLALAQAQGKSGSYLACVWSEHARTNAAVIEQFLPVQFNTSQTEKGVLVEVA
jgi:RNA 3'-terminal phosphate cyclase